MGFTIETFAREQLHTTTSRCPRATSTSTSTTITPPSQKYTYTTIIRSHPQPNSYHYYKTTAFKVKRNDTNCVASPKNKKEHTTTALSALATARLWLRWTTDPVTPKHAQ